MKCTFNICRWHAVSTCLTTPEHWLAWAHQQLDINTLPHQPPEVAFLPAMQRRRLGLSARLMFQAAHTVLDNATTCPMVLVSHDGEINRSFELWQTLLRDNSVSPTSFGLSVHNALAGQWSMLRGDMSENTALAAQADGLEMAIIEAFGMLADGIARVLLVAVDEPLAAHYTVSAAQRAPFPYALAFLLERGDQWQIQALPHQAATTANSGYWGGLTWLQQQLLNQSQWQHHYSHRVWQWSKRV